MSKAQDKASEAQAGTSQTGRMREQIAEHLCRLAKLVTKSSTGFQLIRRERDDGLIEYQIVACTRPDETQIGYIQSTRHDAEFVSACLAQAPLFADLLRAAVPDGLETVCRECGAIADIAKRYDPPVSIPDQCGAVADIADAATSGRSTSRALNPSSPSRHRMRYDRRAIEAQALEDAAGWFRENYTGDSWSEEVALRLEARAARLRAGEQP